MLLHKRFTSRVCIFARMRKTGGPANKLNNGIKLTKSLIWKL